ncbi:MAG TPA: flagellar basal-body MS-ring/collar protein FliF [Terriglobales bacterium]|nr:flagellar basal-body MS-ring/collar protein FliF [Terriglobales bacterium]
MNGNLTAAQMVQQAKEFFLGLTVKQRGLLAGGTVLVAATLCVFVQLIAKPDYKVLYSGLSPSDTQDITTRLSARKIPFETSPDGSSVLVPADKLDSARLEVASQPMPRSGRMGFELFDKPNWAGSDFSEKVNYQRALEAELERTLATLGEVEAVRVHLVMPSESLYSERERSAKASVMVKLRRGRLPEQADMAIRQVVAGAVDRLSPENVVVVDADTNLPLGRFGGSAGGGGVSEIDQELAKRVVETLEPVVGTQGVRASVHVEYDLSSGEETQETYDPASSVALSVTRSEERLGNDSLGGVPGTSSNLPNAKVSPPGKSGSETHTSKAESGTYAVNKLLRHTLQPAGRIKRIAAALLVDDAVEIEQKNNQRVATRRKRSPDEMKQIEQLAAAALGIDSKRGDLLAVENLSFRNWQQDAPVPLTWMERVQHSLRNWSWVFRYLALACLFGSVYILLLRPVKKQLMTVLRELPLRVASRHAIAEPAGAPPLTSAPQPESLEDILGAAALDGDGSLKKLTVLKNHLVEKVKTEPASASRLVQNWLREGSSE